jgi:hypothetical protein
VKKLDKFILILLVPGLVALLSCFATSTQIVHALDATLPVGAWTITIGKGNSVATKSNTFFINSALNGNLVGSYQSDPISGKYAKSPLGNKIEWNKIKEPNIKYTGYLLFEPGCNQSPGGFSCTYTLAGYKFIPGTITGQVGSLPHTDGWYAQITKITPTPPPN